MTQSIIEKWDEEYNQVEIAKKRYRILAFIIDFVTFSIIGMILGFFFGEPLSNGEVGYNLNGLPALFQFLFGLYLWPISEGVSAQTLGKKILNLKVVTTKYKPIGFGQAFGRFFLGFIDWMFLIGIIVASSNHKKQRIGDFAAGTLVIVDKKSI